MRGGFVFGIVLVVLLAGSIMSVCEILPVKSIGTIYIRADGSIDPPSSPIETNDKILYVFSSDINGSITVERNSITIDGKGHPNVDINNDNIVDIYDALILAGNFGKSVQI